MKVVLDLTKLDGNAHVLLGAFRKAALRQGHSKESVDEVIEYAKDGNYAHLVSVLLENTISEGNEE